MLKNQVKFNGGLLKPLGMIRDSRKQIHKMKKCNKKNLQHGYYDRNIVYDCILFFHKFSVFFLFKKPTIAINEGIFLTPIQYNSHRHLIFN